MTTGMACPPDSGHRGNPGYDDTFKDHIQRMIDAIRAAGKAALLSKAALELPIGCHFQPAMS